MKVFYKKILPYLLTFQILIVSFFSCAISVYAADFVAHDIVEAVEYGIEYNDWNPFWAFLNNTKDGLAYLFSQMGAFTTHDFQTWVNNNNALESLAETVSTPAKKEGDNIIFTKEFMAQLKALLDEYAKEEQTKEENGGFYLLPTMSVNDMKPIWFKDSMQYLSFKGIVTQKGLLVIKPKFLARYNCFVVADPFADKDKNIVLVEAGDAWSLDKYDQDNKALVNIRFYDSVRWKYEQYEWRYCNLPSSEPYLDLDKVGCYPSASTTTYSYYVSVAGVNNNLGNTDENSQFLCSSDGRRVRVFVSEDAAINYSVQNRKVYFTENYYSYVPEDLTVSVEDLQKSVDDLQKAIDELRKQIGNDTSEKEIEDLLRQILEELRKNPGTGDGGGGSGGGDVNVDIDLSTTNSWLSKIYTKVSGIFDRMQSGGSGGTGGSGLQEGLDSILARLDDLGIMLKKYLSEITGDLDDIKGQLADMSEQEFNDKSDSFLGEIIDAFSEISEVVKTKFPFSIPNDLRIFLSKIAPAQPEAEAALYLNDASGISLYSGEHGGGGTSDGETNPPGGGGASRPGSGFIGVEHGGGGGSRDPVEMREAPVFRLPIVIERYGIEEYVIIDMAPFDPLSRFSRSFFTIIFIVCLFNLTFKVIGMWGDLVG